jgi:hypothetical protein
MTSPLRGSGPWQFSAYAWPEGSPGGDDWYRYSAGFKAAGDRIVSSILGGQRGELDLLLMPVLYLYRHWIEIAAKGNLRQLRKRLGDPTPVPDTHALERWDEMVRAAETLAEEPFPEQAKREAKRVVAHFRQLDQGGFSFRYPTAKDGSKSTPGLGYVNYHDLAAAVAAIQAIIWGVEGVLDMHDRAY